MTRSLPPLFAFVFIASCALYAEVGDPQIRTDHSWYPGELACSTFERLFASQAEQYERATGIAPRTEHDKALASWFWRNTHYCHGEEGADDLWGVGFAKGNDVRSREYWTGLFAHGFGLCGTTHSQWTAEMEYLLGHGRARGVGVEGHNSFEVFLTGGPYGNGQWALLDHDLSTVIFDREGKRLLSVREVQADWKRLIDQDFLTQKQQGWIVCGLHPNDGMAYQQYNVAEYLPGYAGPPPLVHLRRGETLRRYLRPGLEDGKTFVFWGRNYNTDKIPGPERSLTWVNQPEKMHGATTSTAFKAGQARYANAVYRYEPDFKSADYQEGIVEESDQHVTFAFYTPFVIAATPSNNAPWGIYEPGSRNGLVLNGKANCNVAISVDQAATWNDCGPFHDGMDVTDFVKGRRQYFIRFTSNAKTLASAGLRMTTVCQANVAVLPRLKDHGTRVSFLASDRGIVSVGPSRAQAKAHFVSGAFDSSEVTLEIAPPRAASPLTVYGAAHVASGNPPDANIIYKIDYSTDAGKTWQPIVDDWTIARRGDEPNDFWSQSLCYGSAQIPNAKSGPVQVRFSNSGKKNYLRAETHLIYQTRGRDSTKVTFDWQDDAGPHRASHIFPAEQHSLAHWDLSTGKDVETRWVEFAPIAMPALDRP